MYCAQCGVELRKGVEKCPLCGLRVYHPALTEQPEPLPYPRRAGEESVSRGGLLFIVSLLFVLPVLICLQVDHRLNGRIVWSGVVAFSLLAAWLMFCLPLWFRRRNPVIFFPIGMAAALGLCLYLCLKSGGHWFLPFAFPVGGAVLLIAEAVIVLLRYAVGEQRHRALFVLGGAFLAVGGLCVLIEFLLHVSFGLAMRWWSLIPLTALALPGLALLVVGACRPLRLSLHKKFFL